MAKLALGSLNDCFGTISEFTILQIFSIERIRKIKIRTETFTSFGLKEIILFANRFRIPEKIALECWNQFKFLVIACPNLSSTEFYALVLKMEEFNSIKVILEVYLSMTFSSNECERAFSRYNLIKTEIRSCLLSETINHLLMLGLNGPNIDEFDFSQSIEIWKSMKSRYFV